MFQQCVDVGAFHPKFYSNSYVFDRSLGWRGACVEPNPLFHEAFLEERDCVLLPFCAWKSSEQRLLSFEDPILGQIEAPEVSRDQGISILVECHSLEDLIWMFDSVSPLRVSAATGLPIIDLLLIDTEGSELSILSNFPFHKFDIGVIVVELFEVTQLARLDSVILSNGFTKVAILGGDFVYVSESFL